MEGPKASRQSLNSSAFALKKQRERAVNRAFFAILTNLSADAKVADFEDLLMMRAGSASLSSSSQCLLSGSPGRGWALYCRFSLPAAGVVKLADARDSKSRGVYTP